MKKVNIKFVVAILVIIASMVTLAISSFSDNKQYFYTVDEVYSRGSEVINVPLKVKGNLIQGTIEKIGKQVKFKIKNNNQVMEIVYVGEHALPDTFHNATEAEVVATGKYLGKGEFEAEHIQAKCASKYENDYTNAKVKEY